MDRELNITFRLSEEDFVTICKKVDKKRLKIARYIIRGYLVLLLLAALGNLILHFATKATSLTDYHEINWGRFHLLIGILLFIFLVRLLILRRYRHTYRSSVDLGNELHYHITAEGLLASTERSHSSYKWADFWRWDEVLDYYQLYISNVQFFIVPKPNNEEDAKLMKEFLQLCKKK